MWKKCGLSDYLPKLYGHWVTPDDVNMTNLPDQFVLKANNGCGTVFIVRDKSKLNMDELKKTKHKWLICPYGYFGYVIHYNEIIPVFRTFLPLKN